MNHSANEAVVSRRKMYSSTMDLDCSRVVKPRLMSEVLERDRRMSSLSSAGAHPRGSWWVKNLPFQRYLTAFSRSWVAFSYQRRAFLPLPSSRFIQASWFMAWNTPELSPCMMAMGVSSEMRRS